MSSLNHRSGKRRRRKPPLHYHNTQVSSAEERFLHQAIQNSKLDTRRVDGKLDIPLAPTFYPTVEEFEEGPMAYIEKIRQKAMPYGICKIVPPKGWNPPFCIDMESRKRFQTKEQHLHRLQEGISFGDGVEYSAADYQQMASMKAKEWKHMNYPDHDLVKQHAIDGEDAARKLFIPENLERDYWDIVETHSREVTVEYGNDVDVTAFGSGFPMSERGRAICGRTIPEKLAEPEPKFGEPDFYKETWWNLNNIPSAPDSVLQYVKVGINGINVPWMYFGSLFSTFCWHNEDNYLYSINYHHRGAPKQWYGVPGTKKDSDGLEKVFKSYLSMKMRDIPDLLHHITTMFSPRLLQNNNVQTYKVLQHAGEFVVTFPRSFHGGFSLGPNVGEAVNFATHDWISYGSDANERYRSFARPAVFSHDRLTFTMANHLQDQKSYQTCKSLLDELKRVVEEELRLRSNLMESGVRDVSELISLPRNRLDQLDEESADYDDKRLCHACKHVCFFSAVACECSHSKVSCLRHSHYMCRCPTWRKYLMIWSNEDELKTTLKKVQDYCAMLKSKCPGEEKDVVETKDESSLAPGVEQDLLAHKNEDISLEPVRGDPNYKATSENRPEVHVTRAKMCMGGVNAASKVTSDEDSRTPSAFSDDKDSSSDEEAAANGTQVAVTTTESAAASSAEQDSNVAVSSEASIPIKAVSEQALGGHQEG